MDLGAWIRTNGRFLSAGDSGQSRAKLRAAFALELPLHWPLRVRLLFSYAGDVRFSSNPSHLFFLRSRAFSAGQIYRSSVTGSTRNPFGSGNLSGVPADDSTTSHSRFACHIAYKIEIHRIAGIWQFRPLRGFGRAGRRGCPSALRGVRDLEVGRKRTSPGPLLPLVKPVIAEGLPRSEYSAEHRAGQYLRVRVLGS
jgi:hypothetical protein